MGSSTTIQAPTPPPQPSQSEIAAANLQAQRENLLPAAQEEFKVFTDPNVGVGPRTQFVSDVRSQVFPQESAIRDQLAQNILQNLLAPTGMSPAQQEAVTARRGQASEDLSRAIQTSSNLGGTLYGGRSRQREDKAQRELQQAFAEEDINREIIARQNAISAALPFLQILFPEVGITPPQFQSPVASANTALSAAMQGRGQDIGMQQSVLNAQAQQQAARDAMMGSLFGGLGQGTASVLTHRLTQ